MVVATLGFQFGSTEIKVEFDGLSTRTVEMDAKYARIQNRLRKVDTYLQEQHTVFSYLTDETMRANCIKMAKAEHVYLYPEAGGERKEITIMSINYKDTLPWTGPQPYELTFIVQDDDARAFDIDSEN